MDSASGMLTDRLLITGSDDPLLSMLVARLMAIKMNVELKWKEWKCMDQYLE